MSVRTRSESELKTSIIIDRKLWAKVKEVATLIGMDMSDLVELGLRVVLAIAEAKRIPDDLGEVLARFDPEALELLQQLVSRLG